MQAKVKADARWAMVTACGGVAFSRHGYTEIPAGFEAEALANPYLEVMVNGEVETPSDSGVLEVSPATVELAQELGIDLSDIVKETPPPEPEETKPQVEETPPEEQKKISNRKRG